MWKSIFGILIVMSMLLCGCGEKSIDNTETIKNTEGKDSVMNEVKIAPEDKEVIQQIVEIVGCSERSANSMLTEMNEATDDRIVNVEKIESEYFTKFKVTDKSGNVYVAIKADTNSIYEMYRDSEDGERLFQMIY